VVELAEPAIVLRPPLDRAAYLAACAATFGGDVERWAGRLLSVPPVAMAATEVRAALARGESTPDLDPRVAEYVRTHRVYPPHRPSG
jgi:nicotinic acid mononucleotide adenylyltransferase